MAKKLQQPTEIKEVEPLTVTIEYRGRRPCIREVQGVIWNSANNYTAKVTGVSLIADLLTLPKSEFVLVYSETSPADLSIIADFLGVSLESLFTQLGFVLQDLTYIPDSEVQ